jgi:hypothetical protein
MKLVGPYYGVKKIKKYKNYDIEYAKIFNKKLEINYIDIRNKDNKIYMFHSFSTKDMKYLGRWYNIDIKVTDFKLNKSKYQVIYKIPEFELSDRKYTIVTNVPITITFNKSGWDKFITLF